MAIKPTPGTAAYTVTKHYGRGGILTRRFTIHAASEEAAVQKAYDLLGGHGSDMFWLSVETEAAP